MAESLSVKFDHKAVDDALDSFVEELNKRLRAVAQAGAQVLYDEARARVPVSKHAHFFYGTSFKKTGQRYFFRPGTLRDSIYQVYSQDKSSQTKATYHIAWNHQKAPYGYMVEFGTSRAAAHPFLRPAFDAKAGAAMEASRLQATKEATAILQKLGFKTS